MNHYRQSPAKGVRYGLPAIAAIALAFSIVSVIEGHPGRKAIPPPIVPPESPFADSIAGLGVVEPNTEMVLIASELSGVINPVYVVTDSVSGRVRRYSAWMHANLNRMWNKPAS